MLKAGKTQAENYIGNTIEFDTKPSYRSRQPEGGGGVAHGTVRLKSIGKLDFRGEFTQRYFGITQK